MIWIAVVIALIFIVILSISFPKQMGLIALFIVLGIFALVGWLQDQEKQKIREKESIELSVSFGSSSCGSDYPLLVTIRNNGYKTLSSVTWEFEAFRKGYSSNLLEYSYQSNTSDKILKPRESHSLCYRVPPIEGSYDPSTLDWKAKARYVNFQN